MVSIQITEATGEGANYSQQSQSEQLILCFPPMNGCVSQSEQSIWAVGRCSPCSVANTYVTLQPSFLLTVMHTVPYHMYLFITLASGRQKNKKRSPSPIKIEHGQNFFFSISKTLLLVETTPRVWEPGTPGLLPSWLEWERWRKRGMEILLFWQTKLLKTLIECYSDQIQVSSLVSDTDELRICDKIHCIVDQTHCTLSTILSLIWVAKLLTWELLAQSQHRKNAFQGQETILNTQRNKFKQTNCRFENSLLAPDNINPFVIHQLFPFDYQIKGNYSPRSFWVMPENLVL